ncbi:hypothetical protein D9758_000979 [Tetrapyrgos nigripes]|uniref:F-box domain-containing protein n=1 Tax=Tetrapyrgos nigripes TaxID=182062 RepID=A0A8H5LY32_9AGAR|nr:hypothetical protein D9758_000979 [Tetrapyrgos nigripes]
MLSLLPVELLYEIQLYALSSDLPLTCRRLYDVYKSASNYFQAQYIFYHALTDHRTNTCRLIPPSKPEGKPQLPSDVYSRVLRYPLCSLPVLHHIVNYFKNYSYDHLLIGTNTPELPRRLFRNLQLPPKILKSTSNTEDPFGWSVEHDPLPFLQVIYGEPPSSYQPLSLPLPPPNPNSHSGYALTKAVQLSFVPLVSFLLSRGALPSCKDGLTMMVAIRQKDLGMVKTLVERTDYSSFASGNGSTKRRRLPDRLTVTAPMLRMAVKVGAQDIIDYFMTEKRVIPDIKTLYLLQNAGKP